MILIASSMKDKLLNSPTASVLALTALSNNRWAANRITAKPIRSDEVFLVELHAPNVSSI